MLTKVITYTDVDDVEQTVTYGFQISLADMSLEVFEEDKKGRTLKDRIDRMTKMDEATLRAGGVGDLMALYQEIIKQAVGKREGQLFIKDEAVKREFLYSGAFDKFFLDMLDEKDSGASMIAAMMPANIRKEVEKTMTSKMTELGISSTEGDAVSGEVFESSGTVEEVAQPASAGTDDDTPAWQREGRYPTQKELRSMSNEDMQFAMRAKANKVFG